MADAPEIKVKLTAEDTGVSAGTLEGYVFELEISMS